MKTNNIFLAKNITAIIWSISVIFFCYLMYEIVMPFASGKTQIGFLLSKQRIIHLQHYKISFYLHIFSSLLILAAGVTQFSTTILKRAVKIHRWIGKLYTFGILFISAPAAFVMSFYANGGWITKPSFLLLSVMWWYTTWKAYQAIRNKDIREHAIWMLRSYALTFSAITLRVLQAIFAAVYTDFDLEITYQIVSWASWLLNLGVVEALLQTNFLSKFLHYNKK